MVLIILKILGGVLALALGVYLGWGRYSQTPDEIAQAMGHGKPRKAKRHFMWLNYTKTTERASTMRAQRRYFGTAAPNFPDQDDAPPPEGRPTTEGRPPPEGRSAEEGVHPHQQDPDKRT